MMWVMYKRKGKKSVDIEETTLIVKGKVHNSVTFTKKKKKKQSTLLSSICFFFFGGRALTQ